SHPHLLNASAVDWFALSESPDCSLVKRNSQRDVWKIRAAGRDYFAKLYHPNGSVAKAKLLLRGPIALREWQVGRYAAAYDIATVVPVATAWAGVRGGAGPSLLITEAIHDALPLNDFWLTVRDDRDKSNELTESLARLIARSHQCGLQHGDMHPGNILIRRRDGHCEALFVDLHKVHIARTISQRQAVRNLAQLNQWFRSHATRAQRLRFLKDYAGYRKLFALASPFARDFRMDPRRLMLELHIQAERHAEALWAKRDRRLARNSRYFIRIRPASGWRGNAILSCKHPAPAACASRLQYTRKQWQEWLRDPLSWVDPAKHTLLKDSHTSTICSAKLPTDPPAELIVKRSLARNPWKRITQLLGPSRNRRAWKTANMMRNRDIPTAQPMAIVERYVAGLFRTDSLLLTEYIPGAVDLETFFTRDVAGLPVDRQRKVKDRLIRSLVRLLKMFHDRGFAHRDLKAPNLLVSWSAPFDGWPKITFIDMDGIHYVGRAQHRQQVKAIVRLCASLMGNPGATAADRLRFLHAWMLGPGHSVARWKDHWRDIHERVCEKLADKQIRREWKLAHYGRE
ncbi:MAG TPA: lipopolysaccharide kinase InaA family protein, partial [Phycisphaerae bacterium]|nr:lipopolysaccharide kinase InaA family protein [Phycisphaerae bacterium]